MKHNTERRKLTCLRASVEDLKGNAHRLGPAQKLDAKTKTVFAID